MPPYSKLKEFMVGKYRAIADDPKATIDQRLKALGHLEGLQVKRKPRPKKATSGSYKIGVLHKRKTPKDDKLLGVPGPVDSGLSDSALLGTVENVEPLAEPLQPAGAPGSAGATQAVVDVV